MKLLIVEIIRLLTGVALPMTRELLVEVNTSRTVRVIRLTRAKWAPLRIDPNIEGLMLGLYASWPLPGRDHMAAHVQCGVVRPVVRPG